MSISSYLIPRSWSNVFLKNQNRVCYLVFGSRFLLNSLKTAGFNHGPVLLSLHFLNTQVLESVLHAALNTGHAPCSKVTTRLERRQNNGIWELVIWNVKFAIITTARPSSIAGLRAVIMSATPHLRVLSDASLANDRPLALAGPACSISV